MRVCQCGATARLIVGKLATQPPVRVTACMCVYEGEKLHICQATALAPVLLAGRFESET